MLQDKKKPNGLESILQQLVFLDRAKTEAASAAETEKLLEAIGIYAQADRVYIFESVDGQGVYANTAEWCADGVKPQISYLQKVYAGEMPYWYQAFCEGKNVIVDDIEAIKEQTPNEYAMLKAQDIQVEVAIPIYHASRVLGFFGVDNPRVERNTEFINIFSLIGTHLGSTWTSKNADKIRRRNQAIIKKNEKELEQEKLLLEILCQEYTSVFYLDLLKGTAQVIKMNILSNASQFMDATIGKRQEYMPLLRTYAENFISDAPEDFLQKLNIDTLRSILSAKARVSFRYQSIPNPAGQRYFEVQAILVNHTEEEFDVMLGFRYIDDIIAKEKEHQDELEHALSEARLNNEIISGISKIYFSIFRIDLQKDYYEEISSDNEVHWLTGKNGVASSKMVEICNNFVTKEYRDSVMRFFDLSTLAQRMKDDDTLAIEYLTKEGDWHLGRFIVKKRDSAGTVIHVLYVTRLISDTKRREQKLIVLAEEASRANEAKTEFLSRMAHDIRTPINAVKGFTEIAKANIHDPEKMKTGLEKIELASNYLEQIVNDVLDLTRIEKGQMKVLLAPVSVSELFGECVDTVKNMMPQKHLNIMSNLHDISYERVITDSLHLKQIHINLLSNAVKYTPEGGSVTFEMHEEKIPGSDKIRLVSSVSDTGIGMSREYMKEMYNRFSRAVDTRVNEVRGSGLGLSVVKELVDLLGGKIDTQSELGKGTTFTLSFEFTYTEERTDAAKVQTVDYEAVCKGMHLLMAEDNDLNYEVAEELLKMREITCDRAENGAVCVEKFLNAPAGTYDAILMDMQMPVMDGLGATRLIRQHDSAEAKKIPIIALTANAFSEDVNECLNAGMNMHLSKPFDIHKLLEILSALRKPE